MKNIRLAIIRQKYRPDGGAERFISCVLNALKNSKLEINVIARQWLREPLSHWHLHICNPFGISRVGRERGFADAVRQYCQEHYFDLLQSHERIAGCDVFRAGDGIHQAWLAQRSRTVLAYQRWLTQINHYHRYILTVERDMFQSPKLKKIICNSEMVRDDIINYYGVSKDKLALIYNAVDLDKFSPFNTISRQIARKALSIPEKSCVLIFVGSGFARKGLRQALIAVADTNRYLIVVGQDKHKRRYQSLAQSLGCLPRVRFVGVHKDVLPYYHAADALILPTLYDPFPNVILEAMACGLPVITSQCCGGAEFIKQGQEGFVCDALDINSLKKFIAEIPPREQDSSMGIAARQRISACTLENLSRQLIDLYHQILLVS